MNKSLKLFWIITSAVLVAFVLWFIVLPTFFNAGSSLLKSVLPKKEEIKVEAFSPEAFAYDLGDTWEVNATVNVRGFEKIDVEEELSASLDFSVDFVNPKGEGRGQYLE